MRFRGDPGGLSLSDGFRWGVGAAFGARTSLRFTTELHGEDPVNDTVLVGTRHDRRNRWFDFPDPFAARLARERCCGCDVAASGRDAARNRHELSPWDRWAISSGAAASSWIPQRRADLLIAASGAACTATRRGRTRAGTRGRSAGARAGEASVASLTRGTTVQPPAHRAGTVRPMPVEVGQSVTLRATSQDPDGDDVRSFWSIPSGAITDARAATTQWRAETSPGKVVLTVTAEDGRGGKATGLGDDRCGRAARAGRRPVRPR